MVEEEEVRVAMRPRTRDQVAVGEGGEEEDITKGKEAAEGGSCREEGGQEGCEVLVVVVEHRSHSAVPVLDRVVLSEEEPKPTKCRVGNYRPRGIFPISPAAINPLSSAACYIMPSPSHTYLMPFESLRSPAPNFFSSSFFLPPPPPPPSWVGAISFHFTGMHPQQTGNTFKFPPRAKG